MLALSSLIVSPIGRSKRVRSQARQVTDPAGFLVTGATMTSPAVVEITTKILERRALCVLHEDRGQHDEAAEDRVVINQLLDRLNAVRR